MKKLLSIVIPMYNCENTLARTTDSLFHQITEEVEVIIINDGSTDESFKMMKKHISGFKNVIIINKENEGLINARKTGLENCDGNYYWAIDCGDAIPENALSTILKEIKSENHDVYVFNYQTKDQLNSIEFRNVPNKDPLKALLTGKMSASIWTKVIRTKLLYKSWSEDSKKIIIAEDLFAACDVFSQTKDVKFIDKCLYTYIVDENSITTGKKRDLGIIHSLRLCKTAIENNTEYLKYKKEFEYLVFSQLIMNYIYKRKNKKNIDMFLDEYRTYNISSVKNNLIGIKGILVFFARFEKYLPFKKTILYYILEAGNRKWIQKM